MTFLHVITGLQKAAGTSVFCGEVCNQLVAAGHDVTIAVCNPTAPDLYPLDQRVHLISIGALGVGGRCRTEVNHHSSTSTFDFDLIHIHALWSPILHKVSCWARSRQIPVVWSPHGMITPWAMRNKWWKKQLGWWLYQRRDLQTAALLHVTAQSEVEDVRRMGLKNRVVVAPLGVNVREVSGERCGVSGERCGVRGMPKTLLFVSRVQRKKGLPMLLEAWAKLKKVKKSLTDGWRIRIVGPDQDNHTAELMSQCDRLGLSYSTPEQSNNQTIKQSNNSLVEFVGPLYGDDLTREYASADLFVLPTHSENFGSVVIESLAQGVPVICTKGAPWEELETHRCGRWVDIGVEPLADALAELLNLSTSERSDMGANGRKLVEQKYTWEAVAKTMTAAYGECVK